MAKQPPLILLNFFCFFFLVLRAIYGLFFYVFQPKSIVASKRKFYQLENEKLCTRLALFTVCTIKTKVTVSVDLTSVLYPHEFIDYMCSKENCQVIWRGEIHWIYTYSNASTSFASLLGIIEKNSSVAV